MGLPVALHFNKMLERYIIETIAYYDALDYPLTEFEIWKYLTCYQGNAKGKTYTLTDVVGVLKTSETLKSKFQSRWGFYHLIGRSHLVEQRIERNKISDLKLKKIMKVVRWLRYVPYVRMIGVTGRVAMKNAEAASDLDLLIVLRYKGIFTGRLLMTALVHLLKKRRHHEKITDRICLNYFITDKSLEILTKDLFSASEYYFMLPVFGFEIFREFQKANDWIKNYKINFVPDDIPNLLLVEDNRLSTIARRFGEVVLSQKWLEKKLKKWQMKKIYGNPKTRIPGGMVVADKEMLIFLPEPQGPKVYENFKENLKKLEWRGIDENQN